ncbi:hypothetical protein AAG906_006817 [Vitis piasezkii]
MEQLLTPRDFFYPRVAMDFYQSMTTHHVRDPTVIHFTIDGRHGILGARHIAEALRIPYEPASPEDYRVWTNPSQSDIVRILSRGASTSQYLQRKELPPSMFFIDALLRHNIFPLQHWVCYEQLRVMDDMNDSTTWGHDLRALDAMNSSRLWLRGTSPELNIMDYMNNLRSLELKPLDLKALDSMKSSRL